MKSVITALLVLLSSCAHLNPSFPCLDVKLYGADPTGSQDSTPAVVAALTANDYVCLPKGAYALGTFSVPSDKTLEFLPGAYANLTGTIVMNGHRSRLRGYHHGMNWILADNSGPAILRWAGGTNGKAIELGTALAGTSSPISLTVEGISVNCKSSAGMEALRLGAEGQGTAWTRINDFSFNNCPVGINAMAGVQQVTFERLHGRNNPSISGSVGVKVGATGATSANSAIIFDKGSLENYDTAFLFGGTGTNQNGAAGVVITGNFVVEGFPTNDGVAFDLQKGGPYVLDGVWAEGPGGTGSTRFLRVGASSGGGANTISHVTLRDSFVHAFSAIVEGFGWDGMVVEGNKFILAESGQRLFLNTGSSGARRRFGRWRSNSVDFVAGVQEAPSGIYGMHEFEWAYFDGNDARPYSYSSMAGQALQLPADGVATLLPSEFGGTLKLFDDANGGGSSRVLCEFVLGTTGSDVKLKYESTSGLCSATKDNSGTRNLYKETTFKVQNKTASTMYARWQATDRFVGGP